MASKLCSFYGKRQKDCGESRGVRRKYISKLQCSNCCEKPTLLTFGASTRATLMYICKEKTLKFAGKRLREGIWLTLA